MRTSAENKQDFTASHDLMGYVARGSVFVFGFFLLLATALSWSLKLFVKMD